MDEYEGFLGCLSEASWRALGGIRWSVWGPWGRFRGITLDDRGSHLLASAYPATVPLFWVRGLSSVRWHLVVGPRGFVAPRFEATWDLFWGLQWPLLELRGPLGASWGSLGRALVFLWDDLVTFSRHEVHTFPFLTPLPPPAPPCPLQLSRSAPGLSLWGPRRLCVTLRGRSPLQSPAWNTSLSP